MGAVAEMQRLALYKWVSNMDVSIKQFNCDMCEFTALQSGAVIKVKNIEVDDKCTEPSIKADY
mgnify:CR=1 FL=1